MNVLDLSDKDLRQARFQHVTDITALNLQISGAKVKSERNELEQKRDNASYELRVIDGELKRRGLSA